MKLKKDAQDIREAIDAVVAPDAGVPGGFALLQAALERFASIAPGRLDKKERAALKRDFPEMQDSDIDSLAMGSGATTVAAAVAARVGMFLDHQPGLIESTHRSHADQKPSLGKVIERLHKDVVDACDRAVAAGLTPEGALSVVAVSAIPGMVKGAAPAKRACVVNPDYAMRWLLNGIKMIDDIVDAPVTPTRPISDAEAARLLARRMGVSEQTARKYIREHHNRKSFEASTGVADGKTRTHSIKDE